jgi:hypothetical protein
LHGITAHKLLLLDRSFIMGSGMAFHKAFAVIGFCHPPASKCGLLLFAGREFPPVG